MAPSDPKHSGHTPANRLSMYYGVHGQGTPLALLHGAYMTFSMGGGIALPQGD